jgi:hypothetical protein
LQISSAISDSSNFSADAADVGASISFSREWFITTLTERCFQPSVTAGAKQFMNESGDQSAVALHRAMRIERDW